MEEAVPKPPTKYLSYLLRLWEVCASGGDEAWRASVESVQCGTKVAFATLDELLAFLQQQTQPEPDAPTGTDSTRK